jgi:hypothetical protein
MKGVTEGFTSGAISPTKVAEVLAPFGLTSMHLLAKRPDLVPQVASAFGIAI